MGIDLGVNKLITTSDGKFHGSDLKEVYKSICKKEKNSLNFKKGLELRNNLTNYYVNQLNLTYVRELHVEDLKRLKYKSSYREKIKSNRKTYGKISDTKNNRINSLWIYPKVINKLERICEENGIKLVKVSPAYTSQSCSLCGYTDKLNRKSEKFKCKSCGYENDADINASINIRNKGEYSPFDKKSNILL